MNRGNRESNEDGHHDEAAPTTKEPKRCLKCVKLSFCIVNFIIFCCGVALLGIGIWALLDRAYVAKLAKIDSLKVASIIFIVCGLLMIIFTFPGCCGAWKEIKCLILAYCITVIILFVIIIIGGGIALFFKNEVLKKVKTEITESVPKYGYKTYVTDAWNDIQKGFHCCGIATGNKTDGWKIWSEMNPKVFNGDVLVPKSCCIHTKTSNGTLDCQSLPNAKNIYIRDCYKEIEGFIKKNAAIIGGIGITIACVMLFGVVLACILLLLI